MRILVVAVVSLAAGAPCVAADLDAQIFPLTGEVRLRNSSASAVPFVYYSIASPSGALNSSALVWKSITDVYDVSGNGFIDPAFNWTKIETDATELTEGAFAGPGGSLAAFRSVTLGNIWNAALYPSHDLTFTVLQADMSPVTIMTQFAVAGDYDGSGVVNGADYVIWRHNVGSTTALDADGNLNGIVDAADYVVYRENFGMSLPGAGSAAQGGGGFGGGLLVSSAAAPEPCAAVLLLSAGIAAVSARGRGRLLAPRGAHRSSVRR
jgi:hypothetical protein